MAMLEKILEAIDQDDQLDRSQKLKLKDEIRNAQQRELSVNEQVSLWRKVKDTSQGAWLFSIPILQQILAAEVKKRLGLQ